MNEFDLVLVCGAGTKDLNAVYFPSEEVRNGCPVYTQSGIFENRKDDDFFIWLEHDGVWFISTLKQGGDPDVDLQCYYWSPKRGLNNPPEYGWVSNLGDCPAPRVSLIPCKLNRWMSTPNLQKMLFSPKLSDIQFHCTDGSIIHAHKIILSVASPYFATVFGGPWDDENPDGIWKTTNSSEILRIMLKVMYAEIPTIQEIEKQPMAVLAIAHEYGLKLLVQMTENIMMTLIQKKNVKSLLQTAVLYELNRLKRSCFDFIKNDSIKILTDEDFARLEIEDGKLWTELQSYLVKHDIVLGIC